MEKNPCKEARRGTLHGPGVLGGARVGRGRRAGGLGQRPPVRRKAAADALVEGRAAVAARAAAIGKKNTHVTKNKKQRAIFMSCIKTHGRSSALIKLQKMRAAGASAVVRACRKKQEKAKKNKKKGGRVRA